MVTAAFREAYSAGKMTALSYAQACLQEIERSGQIQHGNILCQTRCADGKQVDADPAADNMKPLRGILCGNKGYHRYM